MIGSQRSGRRAACDMRCSAQSSACSAAPCLATCVVCLAARHGQPRVPWVAVTAMAPRAVRRGVWVPSRATSSTSMAQAEAGGRWLFAGREGCSHTDVDRAWCEGRSWWRGAEEVETEAALGEGGNACGEPVLVETVPGPLAWGGSRLAPGGVGGLGVFVLHPLCDSQADSSKHVLRLGSASFPRPFRVVVSCVDSVSGPVEG